MHSRAMIDQRQGATSAFLQRPATTLASGRIGWAKPASLALHGMAVAALLLISPGRPERGAHDAPVPLLWMGATDESSQDAPASYAPSAVEPMPSTVPEDEAAEPEALPVLPATPPEPQSAQPDSPPVVQGASVAPEPFQEVSPETPAAPAAPVPMESSEMPLPQLPPPPQPRPAATRQTPPHSPPRTERQARVTTAASPRGEASVANAVQGGPSPPAEAPLVPPQPLGIAENPQPAYPASSRRNREEGRVVLRLLVDQGGRVSALEVATSSGFPALDEAAIRTVREWRFRPAMRDGQAVAAAATVGITFRLQNSGAW